jgi:hypothetical protein
VAQSSPVAFNDPPGDLPVLLPLCLHHSGLRGKSSAGIELGSEAGGDEALVSADRHPACQESVPL